MHHVMFLIVVCLWGSSFILMKIATQALNPMAVAAGRVFGGTIALALLVLIFRMEVKKHHQHWPVKKWVMLGVMIFAGYLWPYSVQPHLIGHHEDSSAFFGTLVSLVPLLTLIVAVPILRWLPRPRQVVGVVGGLACIAFLGKEGLDRDIPIHHILLGCTVPLGYATSNTLVKRFFHDSPAMHLVLLALFICSVILMPVGLWLEQSHPTQIDLLPQAILAIAVLGMLCTGLATFLFYRIIQSHGPLFASMVTYLVTTIALIWGAIDQEPIGMKHVLGIAGVLLMVFLTQYKAPAMAVKEQT